MGWKWTLVADSNLPKLNAYYLFYPELLKIPYPPFYLIRHRLLPGYHTCKKIKRETKRDNMRIKHRMKQMKQTVSQFQTVSVTFRKHFRYLGSFVSYNLCN